MYVLINDLARITVLILNETAFVMICVCVYTELYFFYIQMYTYTVKPLKTRPKIGFQDRLSLAAGQKYCRMLQRDQSAILSTYIKGAFCNTFDLHFANICL